MILIKFFPPKKYILYLRYYLVGSEAVAAEGEVHLHSLAEHLHLAAEATAVDLETELQSIKILYALHDTT